MRMKQIHRIQCVLQNIHVPVALSVQLELLVAHQVAASTSMNDDDDDDDDDMILAKRMMVILRLVLNRLV